MSKSSSRGAKLSAEKIFRLAAILLILTLVSSWLISGLLAKYASGKASADGGRVARTGRVAVLEHEAVLSGGIYTLDMDSVVTGNTYTAVLPGTDIPKDPYVYLDGSQEVAYKVYVEICTDVPDSVSYTVGTSFTATDEFAPSHGGMVYKYNQPVPAATEMSIGPIIRGNVITVSDSFRDRADPSYNSSGFRFDLYAYVVQID